MVTSSLLGIATVFAYERSGSISADEVQYWWITDVEQNDLVLLTIQTDTFPYSWDSRVSFSNLTTVQETHGTDTHIHEFIAPIADDYLLRLFTGTVGFEYNITCTHPILEYLVVRGTDNRIYYRTHTFGNDLWNNWNAIPTGFTSDKPATALCENELHIVVRGMDGNSLYHGFVNLFSNEFSGWTWISGTTPSAPTLVSNGDTLCLIVRGTDNQIYYRYYNGGWDDWQAVPSGLTCDTPAAAMINNKLSIVVRGIDEHTLWNIILDSDGTILRNWVWLSGSTPSEPIFASSMIDGKHYLVVRGSDDRIYFREYVASTDSWEEWNVLPSGTTSNAAGAIIIDDELHFIAIGIDATSLWYSTLNLETLGFSGWSWINGNTPSPPTLLG